jgi:hypothetical protein
MVVQTAAADHQLRRALYNQAIMYRDRAQQYGAENAAEMCERTREALRKAYARYDCDL